MKKLLVLLFSILISFNSYGGWFDKKTICLYSEANRPPYGDDEVVYGQYRNGLYYLPNQTKPFSGQILCKDKYGNISEEGKMKNGITIRYTTTGWYSNGQKRGESSWYEIDGYGIYADGEFIQWDKNGQKLSEVNMKDDKQHGKITKWFENGQKFYDVKYKDDKLDGKANYWYENGQKMAEGNYKDGKINGNWTIWEVNGLIGDEGVFFDALREDSWTKQKLKEGMDEGDLFHMYFIRFNLSRLEV